MLRKFIAAALAAACLIGAARAEYLETTAFFTTSEDRYYHLDEACDQGRKYVISEEAALLFGKTACPLCVKHTQPFYTGECEFVRASEASATMEPETYFGEVAEDAYDMSIGLSDDEPLNETPIDGDFTVVWPLEVEIWSLNTASLEELEAIRQSVPEAFYIESRTTGERFDALHAEIIQPETGETTLAAPYPDDYAGHYVNAAYGKTFLLVDPTPESIAAFAEQYGGGVWILPAKFSHTEMEAARAQTEALVEEYLRQHPDMEARCVSHWIQEEENVVRFEFYGSDSSALIDALDLPLCVRASITDSPPILTEEFY